MSRKSAEEFIRSLESLSNNCYREVKTLLGSSIKQMNGSQGDEDIINELLIAIMATFKKYLGSAIEAAKTKNRLDDIIGDVGEIDLDINGKTAEDRISMYLMDLKQNVKDFIEGYPDLSDKLLLGVAILSVPEFLEGVYALHRSQIESGVRAAGTSALFTANIERNIFGNLFYAGRLAEQAVWASQGNLAWIEVVTQQDSLVCEQCKSMAGSYPPDYIFTGNHPRCRCLAIPQFGPYKVNRIPSYAFEYINRPEIRKRFGNLLIVTKNSKYYDSKYYGG